MFKRLIASLVCFTFIFSNLQYVHAQDFSVNQLPVPGTMVGESAPFAPLTLKGLIVTPQKPLEFQFIVDTGKGPQDTASIKEEANQLVKYFLAGLTIPEGDLWVNLSPYEKNRMVPAALGQTDLGRDLLAQDYILKQLTASLIYPEKDLGKEFWSRVYAKAQEQFGTTNVPVNTFNKVWILPDQAQVYENVNAAYVTKATLKVMLDEDYLAFKKHTVVSNGTDSIGSQIVREIVIPEITKEVNTGKNFAPLRQIYQALILAKWYKETVQNGLLDAVYTNKDKVAGVNVNDPTVKEQIYERYLKAYKKGAFNYIKEDPTPDGQVVPRKYFSGGTLLKIDHLREDGTGQDVENQKTDGAMTVITIGLVVAGAVITGGLVLKSIQKANQVAQDKKYRIIEEQSQSRLRLEQLKQVDPVLYEKLQLELNKIGKLNEFGTLFPIALKLKKEGYDFELKFASEQGHVGDVGPYIEGRNPIYNPGAYDQGWAGGYEQGWIIDAPEELRIERGDKFDPNELIRKMEEAEQKSEYKKYNLLSDELYSWGDLQGKYYYKFIVTREGREHPVYDSNYVPNTYSRPDVIRVDKEPDEGYYIKTNRIDELIIQMKAAESEQKFEEYNRLSNKLHQLGDLRGQYVYQDNGHMEYGGTPEVYTGQYSDAYTSEKWIPVWEKVKRSDAAMIENKSLIVNNIQFELSHSIYPGDGAGDTPLAMSGVLHVFMIKNGRKIPIPTSVLNEENPNIDMSYIRWISRFSPYGNVVEIMTWGGHYEYVDSKELSRLFLEYQEKAKDKAMTNENEGINSQPSRDGHYDGEIVGNYRWKERVTKDYEYTPSFEPEREVPSYAVWNEGWSGGPGGEHGTPGYYSWTDETPAHWERIDQAMSQIPNQNAALFDNLKILKEVAYLDAVIDPNMKSDKRSTSAVLVDAGYGRLKFFSWDKRKSDPFTPEELKVFNDSSFSSEDLTKMSQGNIKTVRQSLYDRSSGHFNIKMIITDMHNQKHYYRLSGLDTTAMTTLRNLIPPLSDVNVTGSIVQVSAANQGDQPGNFTVLSKRNSWEFFGGVDEELFTKSYRALVQFRNGDRKIGLIRLKAGSAGIAGVYFSEGTMGRVVPQTKLLPNEVDFIFVATTLRWGQEDAQKLLEENYRKTSDLRHVFRFPSSTFFYDQIAKDSIKLRAAFNNQPVNVQADVPNINELLANEGYQRVSAINDVMKPGRYYIKGNDIKIILLPSRYPLSTMAVSKDGRIGFIEIQGQSGRKGANYWTVGQWIRDEVSRRFGWEVQAVFALDNGMDPSLRVYHRGNAGAEEVLVKGRDNVNASLIVTKDAAMSAENEELSDSQMDEIRGSLAKRGSLFYEFSGWAGSFYSPGGEHGTLDGVWRLVVDQEGAAAKWDAAMFTKLKIAMTSDVNKIRLYLNNKNASVRKAAMDAIDEKVFIPEKKLPILSDALSNSYYDVCLWAVKSLGEIGGGHVVELLFSELNTTEKNNWYKEYNAISDELNRLGHPGGEYKFVYHPSVFIPETRRDRESYEGEYGPRDEVDVPAHDSEPYWTKELRTDKAMNSKVPGGIDLNQINVLRNGKTVNVQFDPAQLNALEQGGFQGFTPVIINIQRISSPFRLLGINTAKESEVFAKA